MANVLFAARKTTTDVLATVSATTAGITSGITALSHLAEVGELNAKAYRDNAAHQIEVEQKEAKHLANERAKINVATKLLELDDQLKDKRLKAIYDRISATWDSNSTGAKISAVAAE